MRHPAAQASLIATALGLALLVAGCERPTEARDEAKSAPSVTRVSVVRPERATIRRTTEQPGQVEADEVTPIHARVAGYLREPAVDIGDRVKKGQVLVELSVPDLDAEVQQKRALIDQTEADRRQAEAAVKVADSGVASAESKAAEARAGDRRAEADVARWQAEYRRTEQLSRESAVTGSLLDETRSKLRAAEAAREEVRAKIQSAEAALGEARAQSEKARADVAAAGARVEVARADARRVEALADYAKIVAPFDGVVTRRNADTGRLAVPGGAAEPLFIVAHTDPVTVAVGVPEADAPLVDPGDPATVRLRGVDGRTFEGQVTRTSWSLDPTTRTLRAEIDLPNPDGFLLPGLYAHALIVAEERPDALTLPNAAIVKEGGKSLCAVVADGRVSRREVRAGLTDGKRTEILSGLDGSESVVATNAASLTDGQPVEPTRPTKSAKP